tara:strand:- start:7263 stop:7790 length:528 start_codon:yes stop_codon:yes gene_type:complete
MNELLIFEPNLYNDRRGYFSEVYNKKLIKSQIGNIDFVQDNESKSYKGTVRGLHFQKPPHAQSKLIRCVQGKILDIAVDLRKNSKSFSKVSTNILSEKNKLQLFIPKGFAHGFIVLSDFALVSYKVDNYYNPDYEGGILWNDSNLKIDYKINIDDLIISEKDQNLPPLSKISNPF